MADLPDKHRDGGRAPDIRIDYDRPDVADIMRQIGEKLERESSGEKRETETGGGPAPVSNTSADGPRAAEGGDSPESPPPAAGPVYTPIDPGPKKRLLLKLMRPFAPLVKLLVLPVHQELAETVHRLDYTNRRMDFIAGKLEGGLRELSRQLYSASDKLQLKVDDVSDTTNRRVDLAFKRLEDLDRTIEYVKLLHGLCHNIVVELTKLKIEEDGLKTQARILEKDFDFLSRREKILERKVFE